MAANRVCRPSARMGGRQTGGEVVEHGVDHTASTRRVRESLALVVERLDFGVEARLLSTRPAPAAEDARLGSLAEASIVCHQALPAFRIGPREHGSHAVARRRAVCPRMEHARRSASGRTSRAFVVQAGSAPSETIVPSKGRDNIRRVWARLCRFEMSPTRSIASSRHERRIAAPPCRSISGRSSSVLPRRPPQKSCASGLRSVSRCEPRRRRQRRSAPSASMASDRRRRVGDR